MGERDGDGGRIEIRTARHQTPAIRLVLKRREKDGKRSGSVRRGRIVGTNERRGGERGPKGDAKETTKRSNAKMASERILGQGLSPVPSEITRPMRALPSSFLSSISLRCFLPASPPLSLSLFFTLTLPVLFTVISLPASYFRIATTPYRWTLYEVAINLCFGRGRPRPPRVYERLHARTLIVQILVTGYY